MPPPPHPTRAAPAHAPGTTWFAYNATYSGVYAVGYVKITVPPGVPAAAPDAYACTAGTAYAVGAGAGVLVNDTSPNLNATLTANLTTQPASGSVALAADGSFVFTPAV
jgi:hypothetical protein